MMKRSIACLLAVALAVCALVPALAEVTFSARTPVYDGGGNLKNIRLAAEAIDGYELKYGEHFSFNRVVGPRTQSRGYVSGENGRGVQVTGGGVSQVASTLYMALRKLGEDIDYTDLSTYGHRFTGDYVQDGDLAVITDYSAGTDFAFDNFAGDMTISMWAGNSWVYCAITLEDGSGASGGSWFDDDDDYVPELYGASVSMSDNDDDTMDNIRLAADSVNDTTLATGDTFSFNAVVGPRTGKYGYGEGMNGRGVRVTGGGVAQVASAVWLAVKYRDDVAVLEKSTYGDRYNQRYVASSADAIVTDYKGGTDFSFRYTGPGTMTIYTYVDDDWLICDIAVNE